MARTRRKDIVEALRQRIARALATEALRSGDRLASTREMARELHADPRVVAAAYRILSDEGLVELRPRSGVYVRADGRYARRKLVPPPETVAEMLTQAAVRGYPPPVLLRALDEVVGGRAIRTLVIAKTADQGLGIARELRDDYGLDASSVLADRIGAQAVVLALRRSDLLVTTAASATLVEGLARELAKPHLVVSVRSDLFEAEWTLWRAEPVRIVVLDPRFRRLVQQFLRAAGATSDGVRVHLATDDLSGIPDDAPTYVTHAARAHIGRGRVPGMLIPPTRMLDEDCIRAIWRCVVGLKVGD